MRGNRTCCLLILGSALASGAAAQATGTPSLQRAIAHSGAQSSGRC